VIPLFHRFEDEIDNKAFGSSVSRYKVYGNYSVFPIISGTSSWGWQDGGCENRRTSGARSRGYTLNHQRIPSRPLDAWKRRIGSSWFTAESREPGQMLAMAAEERFDIQVYAKSASYSLYSPLWKAASYYTDRLGAMEVIEAVKLDSRAFNEYRVFVSAQGCVSPSPCQMNGRLDGEADQLRRRGRETHTRLRTQWNRRTSGTKSEFRTPCCWLLVRLVRGVQELGQSSSS
jgi:hypothetical protein